MGSTLHKGNDPEVIKTVQKEIVYLVCSFESLQQHNCKFVFTDRHAKLEYANFYNNPEDIDKLNWEKIKTEQWGRQFGAETKEMKQAECLVFQHIPIQAIIGIGVLNEESYRTVKGYLSKKGLNIPLKINQISIFDTCNSHEETSWNHKLKHS